MNAPAIVLVRPQLGENIGKAARAMLNFGLTDLRLVNPRDGWPNPSAGPSAAGADQVLEQARVFGSVAEAVADCAHIYATTVRKRGLVIPVVTPEEAAREIRTRSERSVILVAYEWSKHAQLAMPTESGEPEPRATQEQLDGLIGQFDEALESAGYFFPPDRVPATRNTMRTILSKAGWSNREVQALRGMIRALIEPRQRGRAKKSG